MGSQQSGTAIIEQFWQPTQQTLYSTPGNPKLVRSTRRANFYAQRYLTQMLNTNQQQQASIFRERKISNTNIVAVYDFEIKKSMLGCALNSNCYDIITQRIHWRLDKFKHLTAAQMIYVFHQALSGYSQLYKYGRLCYPTSDMIGIKNNGQVKVWVNSNWSDNSFRVCRSERASIQALWNSVKICGESRSLNYFNQSYYRIQNLTFDDVIQMIRSNFSKELMQGRFLLQNRVKNTQENAQREIQFKRANEAIRPRAHSQRLRTNEHTRQQRIPNTIIHQIPQVNQNIQFNPRKILVGQQSPIQKPMSSVILRQNVHPSQLERPSSQPPPQHTYYFTNLQSTPTKNLSVPSVIISQEITRSLDPQQQIFHHEIKQNKAKQLIQQKYPIYNQHRQINIQTQGTFSIQPEKKISSISNKLYQAQILNSSSRDQKKINFSYKNSQFSPENFQLLMSKKNNQQRIPTTRNNTTSDRPAQSKIIFNSNIFEIKQAQSRLKPIQQNNFHHKKTESFQFVKGQGDTKMFPSQQFPSIQPFQLQLNLKNVGITNQQSSQRSSYSQNMRKDCFKTQRPTSDIPNPFIKQVDNLELQQKIYSSPKKVRQIQNQFQEQLLQSSNSRKVAQQFKYYLRSIERSPQKNTSPRSDRLEYEYNPIVQNEQRITNMYDKDAIPQRWDEQQSFSQNI